MFTIKRRHVKLYLNFIEINFNPWQKLNSVINFPDFKIQYSEVVKRSH